MRKIDFFDLIIKFNSIVIVFKAVLQCFQTHQVLLNLLVHDVRGTLFIAFSY